MKTPLPKSTGPVISRSAPVASVRITMFTGNPSRPRT
jgi:hypothetical protein